MTSIKLLRLIAVAALVFVCSTHCFASEGNDTTTTDQPAKSNLATGMIALAAAAAVGLCALATGTAQSRIGAAGCGTLAEKPELSGTVILLVAIPETMVILGFVVAVVLLFT